MRYKEFKKAVEYLEAKKGEYPTIKDLQEFIARMN
jgi:predicted metal-dependent hydrolase